jgi:hypothetical protein
MILGVDLCVREYQIFIKYFCKNMHNSLGNLERYILIEKINKISFKKNLNVRILQILKINLN